MSDLFDEAHYAPRVAARQASDRPSDSNPTLPLASAIAAAEASLPNASSASYLAGQDANSVCAHIVKDILPALNGQGSSARYYGFVTGGVLPIAEWADNVVTRMDQNVQVHLPAQTVATTLEASALQMLADVLGLGDTFAGRTFTTGATASNILGLACGREVVVGQVGELGLLAACVKAGVEEIQVLASAAHSSVYKAAGVLGLGRASVKDVAVSGDEPWRLDLDKVEEALQKKGAKSIIAISAGDVNTGRFALSGRQEWEKLRELADKHGAWIHVDGAMGMFGMVLDETPEFSLIRSRLDGIELADSITVDGHKLLNVPYDCGMFFTRTPDTLQAVFTNPNASYLSGGSGASIPSPLNIGIENSRRFRALPAYAVLLSEGRPGLANIMGNTVRLTRRIAAYLRDSPAYELLPSESDSLDDVFMIALFRAKDGTLNQALVEKINATRNMYVSGTSWKGEKAVRLAVSNWKVDIERDFAAVTSVLEAVAESS